MKNVVKFHKTRFPTNSWIFFNEISRENSCCSEEFWHVFSYDIWVFMSTVGELQLDCRKLHNLSKTVKFISTFQHVSFATFSIFQIYNQLWWNQCFLIDSVHYLSDCRSQMLNGTDLGIISTRNITKTGYKLIKNK